MDTIKTILTLIAIILGALAVLAAIGFIYTALGYLLLFGLLCLVGFVGVRLFLRRPSSPVKEIDPAYGNNEIEETLEEYRRKLK